MPSSPDILAIAPEAEGLQPVSLSDLRDHWLVVQTSLGRLVKERAEHTTADILHALHEHEMQLWTAEDGSFVVTEVGSFPTLRVLTVLYAGGDLETIRRYMGDLEAWARARGCDEIRVHGREGWERVFHMERLGVVLRRRL